MLQEIRQKIEEIQRTLDNMDMTPTAIEKDILKSKIRAMYELVLELDVASEKSIFTNNIHTSTVVEMPKEIIVEAPKTEEKEAVAVVAEVKNKVVHQKVKPKVESNNFIQELTKAPLRSIKSLIDLNKSFIFRQELFQNDNEAYQSFITKLNSKESIEASHDFLSEMAGEKGWDKEEHTFDLVTRIVEKRFIQE